MIMSSPDHATHPVLTLQLLVNGLALGAAYALCALGFVLILNATGAVNFAQGEMVVIGGFVAVGLAGLLPLPGIVLLPAVMALMALLGLVFLRRIAYFPLKSRPPTSVFISTIAVGIILQNLANVTFGPEPRVAPPLLSGGTLHVGGIVLGVQSLAIIAVAGLLIVGQHLLFARTRIGRRLRATAQDREMAEALGIRVNAMIALTFALATALAGVAGLLLANVFFVTPADGANYMLKAYIAATIGGWGRIRGAVFGALLIALFEVVMAALPVIVPPLSGAGGVAVLADFGDDPALCRHARDPVLPAAGIVRRNRAEAGMIAVAGGSRHAADRRRRRARGLADGLFVGVRSARVRAGRDLRDPGARLPVHLRACRCVGADARHVLRIGGLYHRHARDEARMDGCGDPAALDRRAGAARGSSSPFRCCGSKRTISRSATLGHRAGRCCSSRSAGSR